MNPPKTYDQIQASIKAQRDYCVTNKLPQFAPNSGVCWSCRRQIFEALDGTDYVTGCPYCHRSYCD